MVSWRFPNKLAVAGLLLFLAGCVEQADNSAGWETAQGLRVNYLAREAGVAVSWRYLAEDSPDAVRSRATAEMSLSWAGGMLSPVYQDSFAVTGGKSRLVVLLDQSTQEYLIKQLLALEDLYDIGRAEGQTWVFAASWPEFRVLHTAGKDQGIESLLPALVSMEFHGGAATQTQRSNAIMSAFDELLASNEQRRALLAPGVLVHGGVDSDQPDWVQIARTADIPVYLLASKEEADGYRVLAANTNGRVLPWLDNHPTPLEAGFALLELVSGGAALFDTSGLYRLPLESDISGELSIETPDRRVSTLLVLPVLPAGPAIYLDPRNWWHWLKDDYRRPWGIAGFALVLALILIALLVARWLHPGPVLVVLTESTDGRRHRLRKLPVTLGRGQEADVLVLGEDVSRLHARLVRDDEGSYWVEDLVSRNGTFLADESVKREKLGTYEKIRLGGQELTFEVPGGRA